VTAESAAVPITEAASPGEDRTDGCRFDVLLGERVIRRSAGPAAQGHWALCGASRLTTILTTIWARPASFGPVRHHPGSRLSCINALLRTSMNCQPKAGGQGVAGSNPVSPTVNRRSEAGRPKGSARLWREYSNPAQANHPRCAGGPFRRDPKGPWRLPGRVWPPLLDRRTGPRSPPATVIAVRQFPGRRDAAPRRHPRPTPPAAGLPRPRRSAGGPRASS
jgi:hypothetical protein